MRNIGKLDDELDELFQLPLAEFIGARNALAARLKQSGRADDAKLVKTLSKPSVSAWAVNQLYWNHREAFDSLLEAGRRFQRAQTSSRSGKATDMRESLEARREALAQLADLAASVLQDAGHSPTQDTIRRVTTTLEAISANADGPTLGRLSQDVDPPGFESLASFIPGAVTKKRTPEPVQKATATREVRRLEEARQAKINAAKVSLQAAKKELADARSTAQQAEKQWRKAEERLEDAKRTVEQASKDLESLFRAKN